MTLLALAPTLRYVGDRITTKFIRDFILDESLSEDDTIVLSPHDFDELVLEYRDTYRSPMPVPYYLLRILVKEDERDRFRIPQGRIGVIKNDPNRFPNDYLGESASDDSHKYDTIYRCGWCGNVVDYDGSEFSSEIRAAKIRIHQKHRSTIHEKTVHGKCCPQGHS